MMNYNRENPSFVFEDEEKVLAGVMDDDSDSDTEMADAPSPNIDQDRSTPPPQGSANPESSEDPNGFEEYQDAEEEDSWLWRCCHCGKFRTMVYFTNWPQCSLCNHTKCGDCEGSESFAPDDAETEDLSSNSDVEMRDLDGNNSGGEDLDSESGPGDSEGGTMDSEIPDGNDESLDYGGNSVEFMTLNSLSVNLRAVLSNLAL